MSATAFKSIDEVLALLESAGAAGHREDHLRAMEEAARSGTIVVWALDGQQGARLRIPAPDWIDHRLIQHKGKWFAALRGWQPDAPVFHPEDSAFPGGLTWADMSDPHLADLLTPPRWRDPWVEAIGVRKWLSKAPQQIPDDDLVSEIRRRLEEGHAKSVQNAVEQLIRERKIPRAGQVTDGALVRHYQRRLQAPPK